MVQLQKCLLSILYCKMTHYSQEVDNVQMFAYHALHRPWAVLDVLAGNILLVLEAAM